MKQRILVLTIFISWIISSCNGIDGGRNLPPERPAGEINGRVVDGAIADSTINVYSFIDGEISELLASTVSDAQGNYSLEIRARNQPVIIEATGGHYIEEASNTEVNLSEQQKLRSISYYDSGQLNVNITPLTHIATALAQYKISQGSETEQAIEDAANELSQLFNIDIIQTSPLDITDPLNSTATLSDSHLYGLYLAGLSSFTKWAGEQNGHVPHTTYTSIKLAQLFYDDCIADGFLDGKGLNDSGQSIDLGIGILPIDTYTYRTTLAQHLLAVINSDINKTSLTINNVLLSVQQLANNQHAMFDGVAPSLSGDTITPLFDIEPTLNMGEGIFAFGTLYFSVDITGSATATNVEFDIDDVVQSGIVDPENPIFEINVSDFTDGNHWVGVRATDALGVSLYKQFQINFTNINPLTTITSDTITNLNNFPIDGTYDNSSVDIKSIQIQGKEATLFEDGSWTAAVDLTNGPNILTIEIADNGTDLYRTQTRVDLDQTPPLFDLSSGHSSALFSLGNGVSEQRSLQNSNIDTPLYISSDQVTLDGAIIARGALNASNIPFFAFNATDPDQDGIFTTPENITARIQYKKNDIETPWRSLTPSGQEFLVPLASETLVSDWHQTTNSDQHFIRIELADEAGNVTETMFSFRADVYVPSFPIESVSTLNEDLFINTAFSQRSNLYNVEFAASGYTFHNNAQAMYINILDNVTHNSSQDVDELIREHDARLKTARQWRVAIINSPLSQCPTMTNWQTVSQIYNYTTDGWILEQVPSPSFGNPVSVDSDTPAASAPSSWTDTPDFDSDYALLGPLPIGSSSWLFNYDYLLQPPNPVSSPIPNPAFITNWTRVDKNEVVNCDPVRFFQEREFFSYDSVRGPENIASSFSLTQTFDTTNFEVIDHGAGLCPTGTLPAGNVIPATSSWYRIPANHCITIRKLVTTPDLTLYNDTDVATPDSFRSYTTKQLDKSISWSVDQQLQITAIHDAGEENISQMSTIEIENNTGQLSEYQLTR